MQKNESSPIVALLLDTCIWLDLADDVRSAPIIEALNVLATAGRIEILVPDIVSTEFQRNETKIVDRTKNRHMNEIDRVRTLARQIGEPTDQSALEAILSKLTSAVTDRSVTMQDNLSVIRDIFHNKSTKLATNDSIRLQALDRGIRKIAPCHRENKNATADAVILEHFANYKPLNGKKVFISSNKDDFSSPTDDRLPHSDFANVFDGELSLYRRNLALALNEIEPGSIEANVLLLASAVEWINSKRQIIDSRISAEFENLGFSLDQYAGDVNAVYVQGIQIFHSELIESAVPESTIRLGLELAVYYEAEAVYPDPNTIFRDEDTMELVSVGTCEETLHRSEDVTVEMILNLTAQTPEEDRITNLTISTPRHIEVVSHQFDY